ncbi:uncharacterized protein LOC135213564 isoform X2 [Macrobrachium nipponense]|uniref:uncharacterized protein LOC135213564 isoform X2 n=1 Tax=Macrobrachium nipponense TaxID=159736 RepID=UPI0030C7B88E
MEQFHFWGFETQRTKVIFLLDYEQELENGFDQNVKQELVDEEEEVTEPLFEEERQQDILRSFCSDSDALQSEVGLKIMDEQDSAASKEFFYRVCGAGN